MKSSDAAAQNGIRRSGLLGELAMAVNPLDRNGFIPLYYQIQRALMERIHSGELSEGDSLASEGEIARRYGVSRMTARQALHVLKTGGYAVSHRGRGTFVARPKMEEKVMHLPGFTEDMRQLGLVPCSRLLEQTVIKATEELSEKLRVARGDAVLRLRRLRLANDNPMALEVSVLPLQLFPGLDRVNFAEHSLYQVLRENYGVRAEWADEMIEALPATREESELLNIPKRASVLSIFRIVMTKEKIPIEVTCTRYRDRYRGSIRVLGL